MANSNRTQRLQTLAAFLLAFAAILVYVVPATGFGVYQRWPVASYALGLVSCLWLAALAKRRFSLWRGVALGVSVLTLVGFVWWTTTYSTYAERPPRLAIGTNLTSDLGGLRLAGHDGTERPILGAEGFRGTLIVFYRGFW